MRQIKRIFVHCTASSQKTTLKQLENEFKARGWKDPGYHYVVFPDGKVEQMLDENKISNGVQGYNSASINVAYVGGVDGKGKPIDNRTDAQKESLITILTELKSRYPDAHIMGHRDIWGKDSKKWKKWCPCFDAEVEYVHIGETKVEPTNIPVKVVLDVFLGKETQDSNDLLDQIQPVEQEPIQHESLFTKIMKFFTSWMTKRSKV